MANKENGKKCMFNGCRIYFTPMYDGQIYGPECEKKAFKLNLLVKPSSIRTEDNKEINPLSSKEKKQYSRKIESTKSEIKRLRMNYLDSLKGNYKSLDFDVLDVFNKLRESCDYFAHLMYGKYEGSLNSNKKLYFSHSYNELDGNNISNNFHNVEAKEKIKQIYSGIDCNKIALIFQIHNKAKHQESMSVLHEIGSKIKVDNMVVKNIEGKTLTIKNCSFSSAKIMINHDYSPEELVLSVVNQFLGFENNEGLVIEELDYSGIIMGIVQDEKNKNSIIHLLNPIDNKLYNLDDLLDESERLLEKLEDTVVKL